MWTHWRAHRQTQTHTRRNGINGARASIDTTRSDTGMLIFYPPFILTKLVRILVSPSKPSNGFCIKTGKVTSQGILNT